MGGGGDAQVGRRRGWPRRARRAEQAQVREGLAHDGRVSTVAMSRGRPPQRGQARGPSRARTFSRGTKVAFQSRAGPGKRQEAQADRV
jgi:hypothetical protein